MKTTSTGRKARTVSISLMPEQEQFAKKRGTNGRTGVSGYFAALLEYDRRHNIFPKALTLNLAA